VVIFIPGSRGFVLKYIAYADDVILTVHKPSSIFQALQVLSEFGKVTGLHQNPQKLKDLICSKSSSDVTHDYPYTNWSYDFI